MKLQVDKPTQNFDPFDKTHWFYFGIQKWYGGKLFKFDNNKLIIFLR
jgi:hypothetical protein